MTLQDAGAAAALLTSAVSLGVVLYHVIFTAGAAQLKIDTMWDFLLRRAKGEALMTGLAKFPDISRSLAEFEAPVIVPKNAYAKIPEPLQRRLVESFGSTCHTMTDRELAIRIEHKFGADILSDVCIPHGLFMGACLVIAVAVVKGVMEGGVETSFR